MVSFVGFGEYLFWNGLVVYVVRVFYLCFWFRVVCFVVGLVFLTRVLVSAIVYALSCLFGFYIVGALFLFVGCYGLSFGSLLGVL